jgi:hypothetical protein
VSIYNRGFWSDHCLDASGNASVQPFGPETSRRAQVESLTAEGGFSVQDHTRPLIPPEHRTLKTRIDGNTQLKLFDPFSQTICM